MVKKIIYLNHTENSPVALLKGEVKAAFTAQRGSLVCVEHPGRHLKRRGKVVNRLSTPFYSGWI